MSAKDVCGCMNVEVILQQKRLRSTKRHFSSESCDEPLSDNLEKLEVMFFIAAVDAAASDMQKVFHIGKCKRNV